MIIATMCTALMTLSTLAPSGPTAAPETGKAPAGLTTVFQQATAPEPAIKHMTVDGGTIAYTDEGHGTPIVFVHGYPLDHQIWQAQAHALKSRFRVITLDLPGFGGSDAHRAGPSDLKPFVSDLTAFLDRLKTGPVVMAGHSMGGFITLAFLREHPQRVKGLILVSTESGRPDAPEKYDGLVKAVTEKGGAAATDVILPKLLSPHHHEPQLLAAVRQILSRASVPGVIGALRGMQNRADSSDVLPSITVPTLIVTGDDDQVINAAKSRRMAALIPGSRLQTVPNAGHLPTMEAPTDVTAILSDWLRAQTW